MITCTISIGLIGLFSILHGLHALDNGLAKLPPMGWSTWAAFGCHKCKNADDINCISEDAIKNMADWLIAKGYKELGYEYIIMDDCWQSERRDEKNKLQPDEQIFPNGMKNLAEYVHDKNLKLGIYSDLGAKSGGKFPGSEGHLKIDAETFAEWDMDYVKMAAVTADSSHIEYDYIHFGKCLKQTNKAILYATDWPAYRDKVDYRKVAAHCNTWRINEDTVAHWYDILKTMDEFAEKQSALRIAHSGAWIDADLLFAGVLGVTLDQAKAQMAVWAIMPSSLIISVRPNKLSVEMEAVIRNSKVIEVNQDALGLPGYKFQRQGDVDIWLRPITPVANGRHSFAIAFVNRSSRDEVEYEMELRAMGLNNPQGYVLTDLFSTSTPFVSPEDRKNSSEITSERKYSSFVLRTRIKPSGVVMYKAEALEGGERSVNPRVVSQAIFPVIRYKIHE